MRHRIGIVVVVVLVLIAGGIGLTLISKLRLSQGRVYCENKLRELSFFAKLPDPKKGEMLPGVPTRGAGRDDRRAGVSRRGNGSVGSCSLCPA